MTQSDGRPGSDRPGSGRPGSGRPGSGRPGSGRPGSVGDVADQGATAARPLAGGAAELVALPLPGGAAELVALLGPFLGRQAWAQAALGMVAPRDLVAEFVDGEILQAGRPGLASVIVDASPANGSRSLGGAGSTPTALAAGASPEPSGSSSCRLHVLLGWRDLHDATGALVRPDAVVGAGADAEGEVLLYDALADRELCRALLVAATGGREHAIRARIVQSLVSHASLVYDERLFMKCYRVIEPRRRPEIEVAARLDGVGFNRILAPIGHWSREGRDLGLVREFLPSAVEGRALALTSLRDLLARAVSPPPGDGHPLPRFEDIGLAGGDLSDEMRRLGETTAELHMALAEAFGTSDAGIRVHGDYHLRRVMRVDTGWLVAGFGDDPLIGPDAGSASQGEGRFASPLEDVADMWVSLDAVAAEAASLQPIPTRAHAAELASGWVRHNRAAFLRGYLGSEGISGLVPGSRESVESWLEQRVPQLRDATSGTEAAGIPEVDQ